MSHLTVLPGGGALHPHADHVLSPVRRNFYRDLTASTANITAGRTVDLTLTLGQVELLLAALRAPGVAVLLADVGEAIAVQVHPSLLPRWPADDDRDQAPPHGMPRPVEAK